MASGNNYCPCSRKKTNLSLKFDIIVFTSIYFPAFLVCDQFNLLAIRILPFDGAVVGNNSQLLRLTAHPSSNDLKDALEKWRYNRDSLTIRLVGDYLIGSVIKASRLTISQACSIITNHFTTTTNISKNVSGMIIVINEFTMF